MRLWLHILLLLAVYVELWVFTSGFLFSRIHWLSTGRSQRLDSKLATTTFLPQRRLFASVSPRAHEGDKLPRLVSEAFESAYAESGGMSFEELLEFDLVRKRLKLGVLAVDDVQQAFSQTVQGQRASYSEVLRILKQLKVKVPDTIIRRKRNEENETSLKSAVKDEVALLRKAFDSMAVNGAVSYDTYINSPDIQDLIFTGSITEDTIRQLWDMFSPGSNKPGMGFAEFASLQVALQETIEEEAARTPVEDNQEATEETDEGQNQEEDELIEQKLFTSDDLFKPDLDIRKQYDADTLRVIESKFKELSAGADELSFNQFLLWKELLQGCSQVGLQVPILKSIWDDVARRSSKPNMLNLDLFMRFNRRLDLIIESFRSDVQAHLQRYSDSNQPRRRAYLEHEFNKLSSGTGLVNFDAIMHWDQVKSQLKDGYINAFDVRQVYKSLPLTVGPGPTYGYSLDTFIEFFKSLENLIYDRYKSVRIQRASARGASGSSTRSGSQAPKPIKRLTDARYAKLPPIDQLLRLGTERQNAILLANDIDSQGIEQEAIRLVQLLGGIPANVSLPELQRACSGEWQLVLTNHPSFREHQGATGLSAMLPATRFARLREQLTFANASKVGTSAINEDYSFLSQNITATVTGKFDIIRLAGLPSVSSSTHPKVLMRSSFETFTCGPIYNQIGDKRIEPLHMFARLEVAYVDERCRIMRSTDAPSQFLIYHKIADGPTYKV